MLRQIPVETERDFMARAWFTGLSAGTHDRCTTQIGHNVTEFHDGPVLVLEHYQAAFEPTQHRTVEVRRCGLSFKRSPWPIDLLGRAGWSRHSSMADW